MRFRPPFSSGTERERKAVLLSRLSWVDPLLSNARSYISVRVEDQLLIKKPNHVVKLNQSGAQILHQLLSGRSLPSLFATLRARQCQDVAVFLHAVRAHLENRSLGPEHPAVDEVPFALGFCQYPVLSEIALTYRCNLRCKFCYAGCNCTRPSDHQDGEMSPENLRKVLNCIRFDAKVPSVSFTGGEPSILPELPDYVAYAKRLDMRVNLISNGTLLDDRLIERLVSAGLDSAQISLEGTTAKLHDDIVQRPGSFARAVKAIHGLREAGVYVHTNTTLHGHNLQDGLNFPRFVGRELGLERFSMNMVIPVGSSRQNGQVPLRYTEVAPQVKAIQQASQREEVEFMWYSPLPQCLFNTVTEGLGNKGCAACDGLISVAPNGDVLPCASFDRPVGNLLTQSFDEIWNGPSACFLREKREVPAICAACPDFTVCQGACPLYWECFGPRELQEIHAAKRPNQPRGRPASI